MAQCKSCGARIVWRRITNSGGNLAPIDAAPAPNGNVELHTPDNTATVLNRDQATAARSAGVELHLNHFATCPNAKSHRKR